jgi:transcriptional regulator with XRE-family HTH domain
MADALLDLRTFVGLLTDLRQRRGMSQGRLAAECGFDSSYLSRLEAGNREPSRETVAVLCEALGLDRAEQVRLYATCGLLPPGNWGALGDWLVRCEEEPQ